MSQKAIMTAAKDDESLLQHCLHRFFKRVQQAVVAAVLGLILGGVTSFAWAMEYPARSIRIHVASDAPQSLVKTAESLVRYVAEFWGRTVTLQQSEDGSSDSVAFVQDVDTLRNIGYDLALIEYPQVLAYDLNIWPQRENRTTPYDWRSTVVVAKLASDPLLLLHPSSGSGQTDPGKALTKLQGSDKRLRIGGRLQSVAQLALAKLMADSLDLSIAYIGVPDTMEDALPMLRDGGVDLLLSSLSDVLPQRSLLKDYQSDILLMMAQQRHPQEAYVPVARNIGLTLAIEREYVLVAPRGFPAEALRAWKAAIARLIDKEEFRGELYQLGLHPVLHRREALGAPNLMQRMEKMEQAIRAAEWR